MAISSANNTSSELIPLEHRLLSNKKYYLEFLIENSLALCALLSILTTMGIIGILGKESFLFFREIPAHEFFFGTKWVPILKPSHFGVLPLLWGTLIITIGAAFIAIPIGLASAIYLSEYASDRVR